MWFIIADYMQKNQKFYFKILSLSHYFDVNSYMMKN